MSRTEAQTRKDLIDPKLVSAGWELDPAKGQVKFEIPVDGYDAEPWNGVTDYCLYQPNGEVIAVVEAKRQSRDPRVAEQQVRHYVTEIAKHQSFQPFAFMTNGYETYFWDVGSQAKRQVAGFFSPDDLRNLLYIRQNQMPTRSLAIDIAIAGRVYQQEGIRRVCERFEAGQRRSLLVMATGTGKSRTAMALIDLVMRANQARRVLFVADRDTLVTQALEDNFKQYLPDEPRCRIRASRIDRSSRLYVSTIHTLSICHRQFTPGFFDLIIFDEAHRSLYSKFREVVEYFDARVLGLTATPAQFIDRDTFQLFHCFEGIPTFLYSYEQAIQEKYLVDYDVYQAQTRFQRNGIKGENLTEEDRNILIQQGHDPDQLDYEGTELEKKVSNRDTLRKQWEEIMNLLQSDSSGQLPGKTIVFGLSQNHAMRLASVFEEMYPQFPDMVQVITSKMERTDTLIDRFKKQEMPRIAISVDLMDTGVDVPEVVNLVFMKPVHSQIKLMQMIGRGTRSHEACKYPDRLPNRYKEKFLIIDFWENDFEKDPSEEVAS
ncbi:DEAD/DEAH box helicase family protein [Leptolyngbya sp. AN03gr2]|uniref:type I restriction endonuclease subunit R n=1 Tax=unclassified Leptolyngbya TaxID=2650499 RepID=UPI003D312C3A